MKKFDWRGFVSILLFISFVLIALSGIVLYVAPSGRIAREVDFSVLGLDKEGWEVLHTVFGYLMIALIPFHMYFNWKIFLNYFRKVLKGVKKIRMRETIAASTVTVFLLLSVVYDFPPASTVSDLGERFADMWEEKVVSGYGSYTSHESESDHEEEDYVVHGYMTLQMVADALNMSVDDVIEKIKEATGREYTPTTRVRDVMDETGMTAGDIEGLLRGE